MLTTPLLLSVCTLGASALQREGHQVTSEPLPALKS